MSKKETITKDLIMAHLKRQKYLKSVSLFIDIWVRNLKPISAAVFSQESVGIPTSLLKDVKKRGDQLNRLLNKQQQICLMIQLGEKYLGNVCTKKGW